MRLRHSTAARARRARGDFTMATSSETASDANEAGAWQQLTGHHSCRTVSSQPASSPSTARTHAETEGSSEPNLACARNN